MPQFYSVIEIKNNDIIRLGDALLEIIEVKHNENLSLYIRIGKL